MRCTVIQSSYSSSNQVNKVNYYVYRNESKSEMNKPKAIVQISHGMCEYFLRYDDFARFLVKNGYIVCGNDHIGHGNSIKRYNDLGYFAKENGYQYLVEDVYTLTKQMKKIYPDVPIVLLGHSMGSFIARLYLDLHSEEIDGAILSGTSGGNQMIGVAKASAKVIKNLHSDQYRSAFLKKITTMEHRYKERYSPEFDWLSRDHNVIDDYQKDRKCNFTFTVSAYLDLFQMLEKISSNHWGESIRKDLPTYLFSGDEDPVGDFGKGIKKVQQHMKKLGLTHLEMRLYEKGRHEMLNEVNRTEVYQDILNWLDELFVPKTTETKQDKGSEELLK